MKGREVECLGARNSGSHIYLLFLFLYLLFLLIPVTISTLFIPIAQVTRLNFFRFEFCLVKTKFLGVRVFVHDYYFSKECPTNFVFFFLQNYDEPNKNDIFQAEHNIQVCC